MIGQFIYDPVACRHLVVLLEDKDAIVPNAPPESADSRILDEKNMNDKIAFMIGRGTEQVGYLLKGTDVGTCMCGLTCILLC